MGNRQSTPGASCDLICGRGQPITTIASLCARRLLPAGGEREGMREEEGEKGNKLEEGHKWMERVWREKERSAGGDDKEWGERAGMRGRKK